MIFIIFDIEIVFLYPWGRVFRQLRTFGLIEVIVFGRRCLRLLPLPREQRRSRLGPAKHMRPALSDVRRTTQSTIARVGPDAGPRRAGRPSAGEPRVGLEDLQHIS